MHKKIYIIIPLFISIMLFCGCSANTYNAKIVTYNEPTVPGAHETSIFVFRENSAFGSARKFAIVANDIVMGVLNPGTFCNFKVKSGENEIVAYASGPLMHYRVQDRPGETVYLLCKMGYATGMFIEEIDLATANKMMNEFKYMEIEVAGKKTEINYKNYYDNLYK